MDFSMDLAVAVPQSEAHAGDGNLLVKENRRVRRSQTREQLQVTEARLQLLRPCNLIKSSLLIWRLSIDATLCIL